MTYSRGKDAQIVLRVADYTKEAFQAAVEEIVPMVGGSGGGKLSQADVIAMLMTDWFRLPLMERAQKTREIRRVMQLDQDEREEAAARAASPGLPPESPPETIGGHTRGHKVTIDDIIKPGQARPKRRPEGRKMGPKIDRCP